MGIVVVLVLIVWSCSGDDEAAAPGTSTTSAPAATSTVPPTPATTATAAAVPDELPDVSSLAAAAAAGNKVVIAGGLDATRNSTAAVWTFDPETGRTTETGELPSARHGSAMTGRGDSAWVIGGAKGKTALTEVLSVTPDGAVTEIGSLPVGRAHAAALTDPTSGDVLVVGGWDGADGTLEVLRSSDGAQFTTVATLLHPVRSPAVAQLGSSVWVIGGEFGPAIATTVQRVDLDTGTVTDVGVLPVGLSRASGFALDGSIFVAGGRTPDGRSDQIYRIDPITGGVVVAGALPEARSDAATAVTGTTAFLVGGLTPKPARTIVSITVA